MKTHLEEFVEALYLKIDVSRPIELDIEFMAAEMGITVEYILDSSKGLEAGSPFIVLLNDALSPALQWQASHFALYFCIPKTISSYPDC